MAISKDYYKKKVVLPSLLIHFIPQPLFYQMLANNEDRKGSDGSKGKGVGEVKLRNVLLLSLTGMLA